MSKRMKFFMVVLVLVALAGGAGTYYFYNKYLGVKKNPDILTKEETEVLIDEVGGLMELPKDEEPTIATVVDKEKVKDQPFFASAENGDKVLLYVNAKKAILYRPSISKVVEVAPIFTEDEAANADEDDNN